MAKRCGAKTRAGGKCKAPAMANGRCRVHGGASTGPKDQRGNKNAVQPGSLYSQYLTAEEQALADQLELGNVDQELRLTRIRLRRALAAEDELGGTAELAEVTENDGAGEYVARESRKSVVRDYAGLIDKLTARIESLERRRMELLLAKKKLESDDPDDTGPQGFEMVGYD